MSSRAPVEAKVKTGTAAAMLAALALGFLDQYVFTGGPVPEFVTAFVTSAVGSLVTGAVTFAVAWLTKHTPRAIGIEQTADAATRKR